VLLDLLGTVLDDAGAQNLRIVAGVDKPGVGEDVDGGVHAVGVRSLKIRGNSSRVVARVVE